MKFLPYGILTLLLLPGLCFSFVQEEDPKPADEKAPVEQSADDAQESDAPESDAPESDAHESEEQEDEAVEEEKTAMSQLLDIKKEMSDVIKELRDKFRASGEDDRQDVIAERRDAEADIVGRAIELTRLNDDDVFDRKVLMWFISKTKGEGRNAAFDAMLSDHGESEGLYQLASQLGKVKVPDPEIDGYLERLIEASPHDRVKGISTLSLATMRDQVRTIPPLQQRRYEESFGEAFTEYVELHSSEEGVADIVKLYEDCVENYADVRGRGRGKTVGEVAQSQLTIRNLVVGAIAPDIEGEDLDDVSFKLSEYRGKVVMLDFWGDW